MASNWTSGGGRLHDTCLAITEEGDMEQLFQCVLTRMDSRQFGLDEAANTYLLVFCGSLVFFMQAGFAMLCAGSVRKKNTQNTMLKNLLDACGAAISFFCFGFAFAFGGDDTATKTTFVGTENFFALGDVNLAFFFFQYTFAAASVTIVAGSLAERCQMAAYLCYSFFLTGFVYPISSHAVWSKAGFLSSTNLNPLLGIGMIDFSGSGVIHLTGGTTSIIATYLLGSRRGRFYDVRTGEKLEKPDPMPGHSVSLQVLGTLILWFGWFGFNGGSALLLFGNPNQSNIAAACMVNTFLAAATGCISAVLFRLINIYRTRSQVVFDVIAAMNGLLTGLVSVTACCGTIKPWAAVVVGVIAGPMYLASSNLLIKLKVDDVVDAIPVHFCGGFWGVVAVGLFSEPEMTRQVTGTDQHPGLFYSFGGNGDASLLACQMLGIVFIVGWTTATMLPFFLGLNYMSWLRSHAVEEVVGLDAIYNDTQVLDASDEGEKFRDEFLEAYEELKVKNTRRTSMKGSVRSVASSESGGGFI